LEKVFDKVEHVAILEMFKHKGFSSKWQLWVEKILHSGTSSILLSGVLGKHFPLQKRVRQGDPISPPLFIMVAHLLQLLVINEAAMNNIITHLLGQDFGGDYPIVQYADDMSHPVLQSHIAQFFRGAGSHTHSTLVIHIALWLYFYPRFV